MGERLIMLPSDPGFSEILHSKLPPTVWADDTCFVTRAESGMLEAVSLKMPLSMPMGGSMTKLTMMMRIGMSDLEVYRRDNGFTFSTECSQVPSKRSSV